ncbi:cell wall elongation regulator TseB-like domain-containing protein [Lacticaseibacillus saniviri]|uniref:Cell wall elongation regulator TseB-like domain-containing protein n=2 Tax=Lacticaseibacillus saniviri TaxID=931533 RepID=A0A0R2N0E4_9LACO|nr:DUF5590 domain-containing protein [Lacticaseibacillus saniviri]KRO18210.1 hypothetical protein IV56_GL001340 [Lacticaseibacillus saniviri JCM 17471 = DSM 24301]MCG4282386.1 DUF5590 domain-containing protein [Lacticaseibacillus saniviri]
MRRQQRPRWRKWLWILPVVLLIAGFSGWYYRAQAPRNQLRREAIQIATKQAGLTQVDQFYWFTHGASYLTVAGTTKNKRPVYVLIRQSNGKVVVLNQKDGITPAKARAQAATYQPKKILSVTLGERRKQVIWDVSYLDQNGKLGYVSYNFKTGNQVQSIRNI